MGYMKGLNQWLERDVRNRREEFQDVFQTVEELRRQIRGMSKKRGRGDRDRERNRGEDDRRMPRSRTRSERPETTIRVGRFPQSSGPSAFTTPIDFVPQPAAPQPQRWTAIPALIQPLPFHPQQKQKSMAPHMVPANSSRAQGSSRMSFVPAFVQPPTRSRAQQPAQPHATHLQSQPTIILLPAGARVPGQTAQPSMRPVGWQYPENRNERLVRNGTGQSRR